MKVFWSWQSDTPGRTGRHFIREILEDVIQELKIDSSLEEPSREKLELDHDRKGVSGSPDLAQIIFEKIRSSMVFVADVTPVGKTHNDEKKDLINSNVAIELGYALEHVGNEGLLMVLNEAYGNRDSLPFDLKHKAGPISYNLPNTATKQQIEAARKKLHVDFKIALKACLEKTQKEQNETEFDHHVEIESVDNCADKK